MNRMGAWAASAVGLGKIRFASHEREVGLSFSFPQRTVVHPHPDFRLADYSPR
jgi:hypothetical protein